MSDTSIERHDSDSADLRIVDLGCARALTGQQPRGDKSDGGKINRLKYRAESPVEKDDS